MKEKQKNKLQMFINVYNILEKQMKKLSEISEIKYAIDEFSVNVNKLVELKNDYDKDIDSIAADKLNKRKALIDNVFPVCNVLQVYAYDTKNDALAKKMNLSRNKLTKSKDSELADKSRLIWKTARQIYDKSLDSADKLLTKNKKVKSEQSDINSYGISDQMIDELEKANKAFIESVLKLKEAVTNKNKCAKKITGTVKKNDRILRYKLDKLMTLFEKTDKSFYHEYKEARIIRSKDDNSKDTDDNIKPSTKPQKTENADTVRKEKKTQSRKSNTDTSKNIKADKNSNTGNPDKNTPAAQINKTGDPSENNN